MKKWQQSFDKIIWKKFVWIMSFLKIPEFTIEITYKDFDGKTKVHRQTVLVAE